MSRNNDNDLLTGNPTPVMYVPLVARRTSMPNRKASDVTSAGENQTWQIYSVITSKFAQQMHRVTRQLLLLI